MAKRKPKPEATETENTATDTDSSADTKAELDAIRKELPKIYPYDAMEFKLQTWETAQGPAIGYKAKSGDIALSVVGEDEKENAKELLKIFNQKFKV